MSKTVERFQREHRKAIDREHRERLRAKDRAHLAELRHKIAAAKVERASKLREVAALCRAQRTQRTELAKRRRQELRDAIRAERVDDRATCGLNKQRTRDDAARILAELGEDVKGQRSVMRLRSHRVAPKLAAREARAESDDEVRGNIDPALVPVWEARKRLTHATDRMSRTEAFLHWVHDNSATVDRIMNAHHDRELARLVQQEKRLAAEMRKRHRYDDGAAAHRLETYSDEWGAP